MPPLMPQRDPKQSLLYCHAKKKEHSEKRYYFAVKACEHVASSKWKTQ